MPCKLSWTESGESCPAIRPSCSGRLVRRASSSADSRGSDAVAHLIDFTAEEYPDAGKGREYKHAFLSAGNPAGLAELAVLSEVWRSRKTLRKRLMWKSLMSGQGRRLQLGKLRPELGDLLATLLSAARSPLAEEVIHGLVTALPMDSLDQVLESSPEVIAGVIGRNPQFASCPKVWTSKPEYQTRPATALIACRRGGCCRRPGRMKSSGWP